MLFRSEKLCAKLGIFSPRSREFALLILTAASPDAARSALCRSVRPTETAALLELVMRLAAFQRKVNPFYSETFQLLATSALGANRHRFAREFREALASLARDRSNWETSPRLANLRAFARFLDDQCSHLQLRAVAMFQKFFEKPTQG